MSLAIRIQEIRSAAGPLLRDAPGMSGYIAKIDGICHDVQELERELSEARMEGNAVRRIDEERLNGTLEELRVILQTAGYANVSVDSVRQLADDRDQWADRAKTAERHLNTVSEMLRHVAGTIDKSLGR